jgi:hypothetical protein
MLVMLDPAAKTAPAEKLFVGAPTGTVVPTERLRPVTESVVPSSVMVGLAISFPLASVETTGAETGIVPPLTCEALPVDVQVLTPVQLYNAPEEPA